MKKQRIKYVSVKLPANSDAYPIDSFGSRRLPNYSSAYLKERGKKLFETLLIQVPATLYSEVVRCIKQQENL